MPVLERRAALEVDQAHQGVASAAKCNPSERGMHGHHRRVPGPRQTKIRHQATAGQVPLVHRSIPAGGKQGAPVGREGKLGDEVAPSMLPQAPPQVEAPELDVARAALPSDRDDLPVGSDPNPAVPGRSGHDVGDAIDLRRAEAMAREVLASVTITQAEAILCEEEPDAGAAGGAGKAGS